MPTDSQVSANDRFQAATSSDAVRASLSLIDQVVVSATSFATLILLANWCGMSTAEVGIYGLALTIVGFSRTAQERVISNPYLVFVHRGDRDAVTFLGSSLYFQRRFAVVSSLLALVLAGVFAALGKPVGMPGVMLMLALAIPFLLLRDHVRAICAAHFRFELALIMDLAVSVLQLGAVVALKWFDLLTIPRLCLALGLACLVPTVIWSVVGVFRVKLDHSRLLEDWNESWQYSRWLVAARAFGIGGYYAVPWFVVFYLSEHEAGIFATCSALVGLSLMFITGAKHFFQPRTVVALNQRGLAAMNRSILETIIVIGSVLLGISALFFLAGDQLMRIFGPQYATYGNVVFWLSLGMLTVSFSIICGNGFAALAKPRGYLWGELTYCITAGVLAWRLIPLYGLNGAAFALIGAGVAASLVTAATLIQLVRGARTVEAQQRELIGSHA